MNNASRRNIEEKRRVCKDACPQPPKRFATRVTKHIRNHNMGTHIACLADCDKANPFPKKVTKGGRKSRKNRRTYRR